ncbi:MAG: phosphoribosylglycinamide formyltransferase [Phycisphaerae bacterium]|nr:MAG: phosphoribosylglycinamide formyltransferase [Phycisphaerae bacterium]
MSVPRPDTTTSLRSDSPGRAPRLAVFISGAGRTLLNLLDAIDRGDLHATIPLVLASRECEGAAKARARGLRTLIEPGEIPAPRLRDILAAHDIDAVALAGYLRRVNLPAEFQGRVVNIHPALLPRHGGPGMFGLRVHQSVLDARDPESGCTVHLVDDAFDTGPILLQRRCTVLPTDTAQSLADRVFLEECRAYPLALALWLPKLPARSGIQP